MCGTTTVSYTHLHPVEKILSEIPYTDGLSITKLLAFIKYLLQIKDLQPVSYTHLDVYKRQVQDQPE